MKKALALVLIPLLLTGCGTAFRGKYVAPDARPVSASAPELATASTPATTANISFAGVGDSYWTDIYISESPKGCKKMKIAGSVYPGYKAPPESKIALIAALQRVGIAMNRAEPKTMSTSILAGRPIQIQGYVYSENGNLRYTCGPSTLSFTPESGKKYFAEFSNISRSCMLRLFDADKNPVPATPVRCSITHL